MTLDAELARSVLESLTDGVAITDHQGKLIYMNPVGARLVGLGMISTSVDEASARYGLFETDGTTPYATNALPVVRALAGDLGVTESETEMIVRNAAVPDGVRLAVTTSVLRDAAGQIQGVVVVYLSLIHI